MRHSPTCAANPASPACCAWSRDFMKLDMADVAHFFGDRMALDGVSFDVVPGVLTGLLEPNGAGKTTLMRVMLGDQADDVADRDHRDLPGCLQAGTAYYLRYDRPDSAHSGAVYLWGQTPTSTCQQPSASGNSWTLWLARSSEAEALLGLAIVIAATLAHANVARPADVARVSQLTASAPRMRSFAR